MANVVRKTRDGYDFAGIDERLGDGEIVRRAQGQRQGVHLGGRTVDVCAVVSRRRSEPRVFTIDPATRKLTLISAARGRMEERNRPYGLALYKRPRDGKLYAFVSRLDPGSGIEQLEVFPVGEKGQVRCRVVRRLGKGHVKSHVEGMVADDEHGFLYASDEEHAVSTTMLGPCSPNT